MKAISLSAIILSCLVGGKALADSGRYTLWGHGSDSCGSFVKEHQRKGPTYWLQVSWISGFISAENGEWLLSIHAKLPNLDATRFDFLKGTDASGLILWLVNYCRENPLDNLGTASMKLSKELIDRQAKISGDAKQ